MSTKIFNFYSRSVTKLEELEPEVARTKSCVNFTFQEKARYCGPELKLEAYQLLVYGTISFSTKFFTFRFEDCYYGMRVPERVEKEYLFVLRKFMYPGTKFFTF